MPIYSWQCEPCASEEDAYVHSWKDEYACKGCATPMTKIWRRTPANASGGFPFVTKNILPDGKPIEVTSQAHLDQLCKENGVTHRPDTAWISKEYKGYDYRTGKQVYTEGSGLGMPGCWI